MDKPDKKEKTRYAEPDIHTKGRFFHYSPELMKKTEEFWAELGVFFDGDKRSGLRNVNEDDNHSLIKDRSDETT